MSREKIKLEDQPDQKILSVSKDASVDFPVEVIATEADPYHETGTRFHAGEKKAKELVKRGWVTMAMIALLLVSSFGVFAQASVDLPLYNATNTYTLANLATTTMVRDTVTSTATGFLTSKRTSGPGAVTIQVTVTKVSGTVGGTITIQGSLDGTTFDAASTEETRTALATQAPADATGSYTWRLKNSPYLYYRVSYTGGSGAVAYLNARILKH